MQLSTIYIPGTVRLTLTEKKMHNSTDWCHVMTKF